ncbi:hypothetical protein P152DRAFT_322416 [Eremomyces bilateralis CBS 781.70]|uniref:25S rRNA adenine-N(1) methyltransferase n=1 Tax=Eremomyces bilateralis CBS 781.70 TaxID=1392243 RepID=A0A6G1G6C1_9PEZI|nr:uncharacterized protein P152DRAFT_322416 [Eremomyces bilateralis CBS 781.70]KAF1813501.1 hypothetical protein P152DRAFT_322416 [Eremomyces bilateralis CBS 781.70]
MGANRKPSKQGSLRAKSLSASRPRPPRAALSQNLSSKATRTVIRKHHVLQKQLSAARASSDQETIQRIETEIRETGGLTAYQNASLVGQSNPRGGDSSKLLLEWLEADLSRIGKSGKRLRLLEVGAIHPRNAITVQSAIEATRIDLRSSHPDIEQQDFMDRPVPRSEDQKFDILSLSLVLNYSGTPASRGLMLARCAQFLREDSSQLSGQSLKNTTVLIPALFLVLPLPCVTNSRYLTLDHLQDIMKALGFAMTKCKQTQKLSYTLWQYHHHGTRIESNTDEGGRLGVRSRRFSKQELNPGVGRNNFCVVLE